MSGLLRANVVRFWWLLMLPAIFEMTLIFSPGCQDDDDDAADDDDDSGDDDNDDDYGPLIEPERFVRPDLPLNACHVAGTHNTYIWSGPQGGPATLVGSLGLVRALDKQQRVMEIDVTKSDGRGDFLVNHSGLTHDVRLSSILRTVRWWSDVHPEHEMIILGFEWNAGTDRKEMDDFRTLIDRFLIGKSGQTDRGPLLDQAAWLEQITLPLAEKTRSALAGLEPAEMVQVLGWPTIRSLRGRVLLEGGDEIYEKQQDAFFFQTGGGGQFDNNSEEVLEDLEKLAGIRLEQRMVRVYTAGHRVDGSNYDLFASLSLGAGLSALNHQIMTEDDKEVFVFLDENAPGFAPAGKIAVIDDEPTRLGPPVLVTAFSAPGKTEVSLGVEFDKKLGLNDPPVILFHLIVQGLSRQTQAEAQLADSATILQKRDHPALALIIALPPDEIKTTITLTLEGDPEGYEVHLTGPTVSGLTVGREDEPSGGGAILVSPTFKLVDLEPTGVCSVLGPKGLRLGGQVGPGGCDVSDNPSYLIEVSYK